MKPTRYLVSIVLMSLVLLVSSLPVLAASGSWGGAAMYDGTQPKGTDLYSVEYHKMNGTTAGNAASTTNMFYVVAPAGTGIPVCTTHQLAGGAAGDKFYWLTPTNAGIVLSNHTGGTYLTNIIVSGSNMCGTTNMLLYRSAATGKYQLLHNYKSSTNVTGYRYSWINIDRPTIDSPKSGDIIYTMRGTDGGAVNIYLGDVTNALMTASGGLLFGEMNQPALAVIIGTTNSSTVKPGILSIGGDYR